MASTNETWLAATWPFIREHLPAPPARIAELGCGRVGGHIPTLLRAGYAAVGIDPEAPEGPEYRRVAFEDFWPDTPMDAVIASVSLHHVHDLGAALEHVSHVLAPDGYLVVVEWISEGFDEATARWCFSHQLREFTETNGWLARHHAEWTTSGLSWETYFRGWIEHHGLHAAATIRRELDARFVTVSENSGPYYFADLLNTNALAEQRAIDAGELRAGCLRYVGRRGTQGTTKGK